MFSIIFPQSCLTTSTKSLFIIVQFNTEILVYTGYHTYALHIQDINQEK